MNLQRIQEIDANVAPSGCTTCGQQQAVTAYPGRLVSPVSGLQPVSDPPVSGAQTVLGPQAGAMASPARQAVLPQAAPITDMTQPAPMTMESTEYLNGFLRTQIGQQVRVSFLIGTNSFLDKAGKLLDVGANYIILQEAQTDDLLICDFYTIKFVTVYH